MDNRIGRKMRHVYICLFVIIDIASEIEVRKMARKEFVGKQSPPIKGIIAISYC